MIACVTRSSGWLSGRLGSFCFWGVDRGLSAGLIKFSVGMGKAAVERNSTVGIKKTSSAEKDIISELENAHVRTNNVSVVAWSSPSDSELACSRKKNRPLGANMFELMDVRPACHDGRVDGC